MIEPVCHNISVQRNRVIISQSKMSLLYIITYAKKTRFGCVRNGCRNASETQVW